MRGGLDVDPADREVWEELGRREDPSWYLHPLAGAQKREAHLELIRKWTGGLQVRRMLKSDLFEEAFGPDHILPAFTTETRLACGMDSAYSTARSAARSHPSIASGIAVMDVRAMAWRDESFDLILSTSTLDHFAVREDYLRSLRQLAASLRPGGVLVLTLDNPLNPLFHALRLYGRGKNAPFPLGYTPAIGTLVRDVRECGLDVENEEWILHNPRGISTLLFLALSKLFGQRADPLVTSLLNAFGLLGSLPTRRFTACFQAVKAVKPKPR